MVFRFFVIRKNSTFALLLITFANGIYLIKKIVLDMKNKSLAFLYPVLIVAVMLLWACANKKDNTPKAPVAVSVVTVGGTDSGVSSEYVGSIVERSGTALSFEVPGNVLRLMVDQGDHVSKGQLLATLDPVTLRDAHQLTLTTLHQAEDAYRRFEPLHKQGVVSDIRWVEIQTKLEQAQSSERLARTQLQRTSLVAPFSGVISERTAERGMNVMAGQQIYRLVDISSVDVKMSVPEGEVSSIKVGARARVSVKAVGGKSYEAVVKEKGVEANAVSHTYSMKLGIVNSDGKLMPGMVCSVEMAEVSQSSVGTLAVPLNAVKLDSDNRRFVWLAVAGKAHQQYIIIGNFVEGGVIVTSGLKAGDKVITEGSQKVSEGQDLRIKN